MRAFSHPASSEAKSLDGGATHEVSDNLAPPTAFGLPVPRESSTSYQEIFTARYDP